MTSRTVYLTPDESHIPLLLHFEANTTNDNYLDVFFEKCVRV
jgi:hypothetical protein